MFTGLVQALGEIEYSTSNRIAIRVPSLLRAKLAIGDSVSVNGICLTVAEILHSGFVADLSPETRARSNLSQANQIAVNLEPALAAGDRLGGHFVTGHIDGVGYLSDRKMEGEAWELSFTAPETVAKYIVSKGSIAVNGVSLTVAQCNEKGTWFSTAVIPHTYHNTNLSSLKQGSSVNLEADVLGKYVEKLLHFAKPGADASITASSTDRSSNHTNGSQAPEEITMEFLTEHGW